MLERLQYALILLLFALAGSLADTSFRSDAGSVQPVLTETAADSSPAPGHNYLSVLTHPCDFSAEAPVVSFDHKAIFRQRTAVRTATDAAFGVRAALCTSSRVLHGKPADYYVFTLGRILI